MGKYDRYVTADPGAGKYGRYLPEIPREKEHGRVSSAFEGARAGEGWGFRDEAEGGNAARWEYVNQIRRMLRMPEVSDLEKKATNFISSRGPGRVAGGVIDAAVGLGTEMRAPEDSEARKVYTEKRDARREVETVAREDNPWSYGTGEFAAAMASLPLPALGTGAKAGALAARAGGEEAKRGILKALGTGGMDVLKTTATGATTGGAFGAVSGAGNAEGGIEERISGAGSGTIVGGAFGAGLAPIARYVAAPLAAVVGRKVFTSAESKALDMVIKRAKKSNRSLEDVRADFDAWAKSGEVPETLAELMGPNERGLLSAAITSNKETRSRAGEVLLGRGRDEVDRLEGKFAENMGAGRGDFPKAKAEAAKARAEDPEPLYDFAHFYELDGRKYQTYFNKETAHRFVNEVRESEVALESVKQAARYADTMRQPKIRDELRKLASAIEGGSERAPRVSVQAADYVERMINRKYDKALSGHSDDIPGGLRTLRDSIRAIIDPSGIGDARGVAAERIQRGRLLDEGRKFMHKNVDVEDVNNVLRGDPSLDIAPASPEGQRAYTTGAARAIADDLRNTSDMKGFADATRKIARTPAIREKVDAVRPKVLTKKGVEHKGARQTRLNRELDESIERTADRAEFTNDMLGNSRTAFRQGDVAEATAEDAVSSHIGDFLEDLIMRGPGAAQANAWQKFGNAANMAVRQPGVLNPKINKFIGDMLLASGDEIPGQLARLQAREAATAGRRLLPQAPQRMASKASGYYGGQSGAEGDPYAQDFDTAYAADAMKADEVMFDILERATPEERAAIEAEYERLTRYMSPDEADLVRRVLAHGRSAPAALPAPQ